MICVRRSKRVHSSMSASENLKRMYQGQVTSNNREVSHGTLTLLSQEKNPRVLKMHGLYLVLCPNKDSNKDNKLLWPLNLSDPVQRCEDVGGQTFVLLYSLHSLPCHPNPPPLQVSSILLCTPKLHGLSFQLFPQNVNHFNSLSLLLYRSFSTAGHHMTQTSLGYCDRNTTPVRVTGTSSFQVLRFHWQSSLHLCMSSLSTYWFTWLISLSHPAAD